MDTFPDQIGFLSSTQITILLANALIGIFLFERSWLSLERFRHPPSKELDELFPAFRRSDAVLWRKWHFYPGAALFLVPKTIFIILVLLANVFFTKLLLLCHDHRKPYIGLRKLLINLNYHLCARLIGLVGFFTWHRYKYVDCDYSEYLGTNLLLPSSSSIGGINKELYSRTDEHSSRFSRSNFVQEDSLLRLQSPRFTGGFVQQDQ
jgi:1-acyl-sn-glycerol-3-phosphate acyltransferase